MSYCTQKKNGNNDKGGTFLGENCLCSWKPLCHLPELAEHHLPVQDLSAHLSARWQCPLPPNPLVLLSRTGLWGCRDVGGAHTEPTASPRVLLAGWVERLLYACLMGNCLKNFSQTVQQLPGPLPLAIICDAVSWSAHQRLGSIPTHNPVRSGRVIKT